MNSIAANPTILCGYSDITSLHHGIHRATGLVTFHGPAVIPQWGAVGGPFDYTVDHFQRVVGEARPPGRLPHSATDEVISPVTCSLASTPAAVNTSAPLIGVCRRRRSIRA